MAQRSHLADAAVPESEKLKMDWIYLSSITLLAATLQSATGFGFGLIAVPIFLLILDSREAIQMVMIIILCMSFLDWIKLRGQASIDLLKWLSTGSLIGFPFGIYIYNQMDLPLLKMIIAVVILFFSLYNLMRLFKGLLHDNQQSHKHSKWITIFTGSISGLMSTSLAMPGPAVMLYLVHRRLDKTLIRATILTFFIFSYASAILLQSLIAGISGSTWYTSLTLAPVGLLGVLAGHYLAGKINQRLFKLIVLTTLILTALVMLLQL